MFCLYLCGNPWIRYPKTTQILHLKQSANMDNNKANRALSLSCALAFLPSTEPKSSQPPEHPESTFLRLNNPD